MPIRVRVLYFGQAREAAGRGVEEISLPGNPTLGTLVDASMRAHQSLEGLSRAMRFAVNEEIAKEDRRLTDGDVVAFLPPSAGG